jgi:hypothetical protein
MASPLCTFLFIVAVLLPFPAVLLTVKQHEIT